MRKIVKKKLFKALLILFLLFNGAAAFGQSQNYYIDSIGGNDSNNGLTKNTAWKSLSKANTVNYNPGDSLKLRRGQVFTGGLSFGWYDDGSAASPIVVCSYIKDSITDIAKPIIRSNTFNLSPIDTSKICISLQRNKYIKIKDLELRKGRIGVLMSGSENVILDNIGIDSTWRSGISITPYNHATDTTLSDSNTIVNCNIKHTGLRFIMDATPVVSNGTGSGIHIQSANAGGNNNIIQNCEISFMPDLSVGSEHGIYDHGNFTTYEDNYIHDITGTGIKIKNIDPSGGFTTGSYDTVRCNYFERCKQGAVQLSFGRGNTLYDNVFDSCGNGGSSKRSTINYMYHIVSPYSSMDVHNNYFFDNDKVYLLGQPYYGVLPEDDTIHGYDWSDDGVSTGITAYDNYYKWNDTLVEKMTYVSGTNVRSAVALASWISETNSCFNSAVVAPDDLSIEYLSPTSAQLNWTKVTGDANAYEIKFYKYASGSWTCLDTFSVAGSVDSLVLTGLGAYEYKFCIRSLFFNSECQEDSINSTYSDFLYYMGHTEYFIDQKGNDALDGKTKATAWKTLTKVNAINFEPGDQIRLRKGQVFDTICSLGQYDDGNATYPIIIDSYDSLATDVAMPIIRAAKSDVSSSYRAITLQNNSYITVRNLEFTYGLSAVLVWGSNHITLENLVIDSTWKMGIQVSNYNTTKSQYVTVDNCSISHTGRAYSSSGGSSDGAAIYFGQTNAGANYSVIKNCHISDITNGTNNSTCGVLTYEKNMVIENNNFRDIPTTALIIKNSDTTGFSQGSNNTIQCDTFVNCGQGAIRLDLGKDNIISSNVFDSCGYGNGSSERRCINYIYQTAGGSGSSMTVDHNNFVNNEVIYLLGQPNISGKTYNGVITGITVDHNYYEWSDHLAQYYTSNSRSNYVQSDWESALTETGSTLNTGDTIPTLSCSGSMMQKQNEPPTLINNQIYQLEEAIQDEDEEEPCQGMVVCRQHHKHQFSKLIFSANPSGCQSIQAKLIGLDTYTTGNLKLEIHNVGTGQMEKSELLQLTENTFQIEGCELSQGSHEVIVKAEGKIIAKGHLMIIK